MDMKKKSFNDLLGIDDDDKKIIEMIEKNPSITHSDIAKEIEKSQTELAQLEGRLNDEAFLTKAPAAIVDKERQKLYTLIDKLERLRQQILKF